MSLTFGTIRHVQAAGFRAAFRVCPAYSCVYIANAKSGATTIKLALLRSQLDDPKYQSPHIHTDRALPGPRLYGWDKTLELVQRRRCFTFVRNPLRRVISAYLNKIMGKEGVTFQPECWRALGQPVDFSKMTFDLFLDSIEATPPERQNKHWRPQHLNILLDHIDYGFIGRLERFDEDFTIVRNMFGLPDFPVEPQNQQKARWQDVIEGRPDRAARIERLYAKDFELLGY